MLSLAGSESNMYSDRLKQRDTAGVTPTVCAAGTSEVTFVHFAHAPKTLRTQ